MMKELKSYSSGFAKKEMKIDFEWQEGYGGFSHSESQLPALTRYIQNQKQHHQTQTLDDEIQNVNHTWKVEWCLN